VREGEPASGERQAFVPGVFGNIFDVLVASRVQRPTSKVQGRANAGSADVSSALSAGGANRVESPIDAIDSYRAIIVGGDIKWTSDWAQKLFSYVRNGGVIVLNTAQTSGLSTEFLGVQEFGALIEADAARFLAAGELPQDLSGQAFRYRKVVSKGSEVLIATPNGDPLVTVNTIGRGKVVFVTVPHLLGEDERLVPLAAHLLAHLAADATPVKVEGDVEYLINRNSRGWVVTLFNDNGVFKQQQGLAQVDRSANVSVTIGLRGAGILSAVEWTADQTLSVTRKTGASDSVTLNIAAGGIAVVELVSAR